MSECKIPCGASCGATQMYNPVDVLAPVFDSGLPMLEAFWPDYTMNPFLFGNFTNPDWSLGVLMKNRRSNGIKVTDDNCGVAYHETYNCDMCTAVTAISGVTITVSDVSLLRGINTGVILHFVQENPFAEEYATVDSVAGNVITLTSALTVVTDVSLGVKVYRAGYNSTNGDECNTNANNKYTSVKTSVFTAPFRRLRLTADVKQCELTVQRYGTENPWQLLLDDITRSNKIGRQNELSSYFYSDNAWVLGNTGNINSNHTQGLRTGIQFAETETGVNLSYDMSECCDPTQSDCANHKAMIEALLSILEDAYDTGLYNGKAITGVINKQQKKALTMLTRDLIDTMGFQLFYNDADTFKSIYSNLDAWTIQFGSVRLDLYYDKFLDRLGKPYMAIMPVDYIYFVQRPFVDVTADSNGNLKANTNVMNGMPTLKLIDRTDIEGDGSRECYKMKFFMDFAFVFSGMCSGAYREFFNFAPCGNEACDACANGRSTVSKFLS